ncbi:UNVERIFIED_CONTAM: hypothetical protein Slati_3423900 [Sesamum latifolium]|uniref:Uncharacterized protein n=1 Tax=Sesamum latifolium TaxID=2727402 RepID=A0AAW2UI70_9LAMI
MASSDESVRFVRPLAMMPPKSLLGGRPGLNPSVYTGGQQWSLRQAAVVSRCLLNKPSNEEEEVGGNEEEEDSSPCEETRKSSEEGERGAGQPVLVWALTCLKISGGSSIGGGVWDST